MTDSDNNGHPEKVLGSMIVILVGMVIDSKALQPNMIIIIIIIIIIILILLGIVTDVR